ncbi:hypothetical protein O0L34_g19528 [Tuta absoluta]|nr:hypothetical protein O0L34_g19528 [Tuta absoluta]
MLAMTRQLADLQAVLDRNTDGREDSSDEDNTGIDMIQSDLNHANMHQQFVDSLGEIEFEDNFQNDTLSRLTSVRCAAHTLQLAVKYACSDIQPLLEQCRQVVRSLRTPNVAMELRQNKLQQAVLDCPTQWDSTVNMLERLVQLKDFCLANSTRFGIDGSTWTRIEQSLQVLKPCSVLSKKLQREQLTIGDFFIFWMKCRLELESKQTAMSIFLTICMTDRERVLLENDVFLAAIYLDPRVNSTLSEEQCEKARQHLIATYLRYDSLMTSTEHTTSQNQTLEQENTNNIEVLPSIPDTSADSRPSTSTAQPAHGTQNMDIDAFFYKKNVGKANHKL